MTPFAEKRSWNTGKMSSGEATRRMAKLLRRRIAVPGLVVGGADESDVFQAGYAATPGRFDAPCDVHILGGAGHWPHREQEQAFVEVLLPFLRG